LYNPAFYRISGAKTRIAIDEPSSAQILSVIRALKKAFAGNS
jgi:hypothetical protein